MIQVVRLSEPEILTSKKLEWTARFIASNKARPSNSQYGHPDVKASLYAMSFWKCYYCERPLKNTIKEIDHFIEIAERKDLAFEWTNLNLACDNCNGKLANRVISVSQVLNPCTSLNTDIERALYFEDEQIMAVAGSQIGLDSIKKYKLNSDLLDRLRSKRLNAFYKKYCEIKDCQALEARTNYSSAEENTLLSFASPDQPYSLMFKLLLRLKGFHI